MSANVSPEQKLSQKQHTFISALLAGHTIVTSAATAGIAEKTAHQWLKLAHVQEAYKAAQRVVFDQALAELMSGVDEAIKGIKEIAKESEVPANIRLRAYQIWLEQAIALHKMSDLEKKIAELEEAVKDIKT